MAESLPPGTDIWTTPAGQPPPGVTPNFVDPEWQGWIGIVVGSIFQAILLAVLGFRFYCRLSLLKRIEFDDGLTLLAGLGTTMAYVVLVLDMVVSRFGTHIWDLPLGHVLSDSFLKLSWVESFTTLFNGIVKLTFLVLYLKIFSPFRWLKLMIILGIIVDVGFFFSVWVVSLYATTPTGGETWSETITNKRYLLQLKVNPPLGYVSLILDVYIFVLPLLGVSRLRLSRKRKYGVIGVFMVGLIAIAASSTSLAYRQKLNEDQSDYTWETWIVILTAYIELAAGTTASSLPSLVIMAQHQKLRSLWSKLSTVFRGSGASNARLAGHASGPAVYSPSGGQTPNKSNSQSSAHSRDEQYELVSTTYHGHLAKATAEANSSRTHSVEEPTGIKVTRTVEQHAV